MLVEAVFLQQFVEREKQKPTKNNLVETTGSNQFFFRFLECLFHHDFGHVPLFWSFLARTLSFKHAQAI